MCKRTGVDSGTSECHDHCKLLVVGTSLHLVCYVRLLTKTLSCKLAIQHVLSMVYVFSNHSIEKGYWITQEEDKRSNESTTSSGTT